MPYQQSAVTRALVQGGRVLLADEMGLGKTAEALSIVAQYLDREGPALVIIPPSLGGVWRNQVKKWLPHLRHSEVQLLLDAQQRVLPQARIVIISYTLFVRKAKLYSKASDSQEWRIVVCDEAHYLRNPASQRSKALLPVLHAAERVVLVTGTPTPKQASEAYTLIHALRPIQCSFKEWCDRYGSSCTERREVEVAAMLGEVMVRRTKAEVMEELPPRHRQRVELQLSSSAKAVLKGLHDRSADEEYFQQLAKLKEAAVQDYVEYLLEAADQKFLLFGHHRAMLNSLQGVMEQKGVDFIRIDGSTPVAERSGLVRRFQKEPTCRVAVLSILAAGEGLSFTSASLCVFCELCPAVPGVIEQAEARIHRMGQQASHVDVHFLVVDGTRDDKVFTRLESRSGSVAQATGNAALSCLDSNEEPESTPLDSRDDGMELCVKPHARSAQAVSDLPPAPKKKRRKAGLDLGSVLDREIARAQADIAATAHSCGDP
jgi:SNF2 family DNA or RNA helicase